MHRLPVLTWSQGILHKMAYYDDRTLDRSKICYQTLGCANQSAHCAKAGQAIIFYFLFFINHQKCKCVK